MKRDALRYVYGSTSLSFAIRIAGVGVMFAAMILLARAVPPSEFGLYAYIVEIVALGAVVVSLGFDQIAVRVVPDRLAEGDRVGLRRFVGLGIGLTLLVSGALAAGLLGAWQARAFPVGFGAQHVALTAALLLCLALLRLGQEIVRAARRIAWSQLFEQLIWPIVLLVLAGAALAGLWRVQAASVLAVQCAVLALGAVFLFAIVRRMAHPGKPGCRADDATPWAWLAISLPLALSAMLSVFLNRGDIIALGFFVSSAELAPYTAASRYAALLVLGLAAAAATTAPLMREYWRMRDIGSLQGCVDRAAALSLLIALPLAALFFAFPRAFLSLYGPHYEQGAQALRILTAAQLVNAITGPVALLVIVCEMQRIYALLIAAAAALLAGLLALLTPRYGLVGAAWATFVALSLLNLGLAAAVWRTTGVLAWATPGGIAATVRDFLEGTTRIGTAR